MSKRVKIYYKNSSNVPIRVVVEPWANEILVLPGGQVEIDLGTEQDDPLIEIHDSSLDLTIFAQPGVTLRRMALT